MTALKGNKSFPPTKRGFERGNFSEGSFGEINKFREGIGLRPIERKERDCLKCGIKFMSVSIGNHMCYHCGAYYDENLEGSLVQGNRKISPTAS